MIRNLACLLIMLPFTSMFASSNEGVFLNVAILTLPDRYLDDIPKSERTAFLLYLSDYSEPLINYKSGRLNYYSDSSDDSTPNESQFGTSPMFMKLLPRKGDEPLVFVHTTDNKNGIDKTFVLEKYGSVWADVTVYVMPKGVDLTEAFIPRIASPDIDVALERNRKGRSGPYIRIYELKWNGTSFEKRKASKIKLSNATI